MPIRLFFSSIHMSFLSNSSAKTDKLNPVIPIPKKTKNTDNLKKTIQTPQKNISNLENLLLLPPIRTGTLASKARQAKRKLSVRKSIVTA